jgi:hypothetical protein
MKSDLVLIAAIACLTILGVIAAFAFTQDVARILYGACIVGVGAIAGVDIHLAFKNKNGTK